MKIKSAMEDSKVTFLSYRGKVAAPRFDLWKSESKTVFSCLMWPPNRFCSFFIGLH